MYLKLKRLLEYIRCFEGMQIYGVSEIGIIRNGCVYYNERHESLHFTIYKYPRFAAKLMNCTEDDIIQILSCGAIPYELELL